MTIKENLYSGRIISIDAFRGITILVMIFVNELAGVSKIPQWMKHMPAEADAMTFVDVVFPAFLFIVGMSIPFAFNARLIKGDKVAILWKHTLKRSFALIIMGLFMVNAAYGYNEELMLISPALWALFAYTLPIPLWNKYSKGFPRLWKGILQYGGILGFVALYFLYIQENGQMGMTEKWWGILGLIGWAYLLTVVYYWCSNGKITLIVIFFFACLLANIANLTDGLAINQMAWFRFIAGHLTQATLVTTGIIVSLLLFERKKPALINWQVIGFGLLLFLLGYLLRPYYEVSKIRGTPSWSLYSAGICTFFYYGLYWLMELKKRTHWSSFIMPAAANPLLIYLLPGIIIYFNKAIGLQVIPDYFGSGVPGIIWCATFSVLMLYLMKSFNKWGVQLHL